MPALTARRENSPIVDCSVFCYPEPAASSTVNIFEAF
jgi:hypothetical protein